MVDIFVIKKPWVTERSTDLSKIGKYVFLVKANATKPEIKKAVKEIYKVEPISVNIINRQGKKKRFGARKGRQPGHKKAIVTLKAGQKIDVQ
ncbi:MAG: 50S ribosomal protein L23 [bacterium]|nr:50S ribosomal protein L23 [bacterium]